MNYIISSTRHQNLEPIGSEKVLNKMNITECLLTLTTAVLVLVQFCELLISRSCSLKQDFQSDDKLTNIMCDWWHSSDRIRTLSSLFITTDNRLISEVHEGNRKGRGFSAPSAGSLMDQLMSVCRVSSTSVYVKPFCCFALLVLHLSETASLQCWLAVTHVTCN